VRILGLLVSFVALIAAVPLQTSQTSDAYVRTWLRDTMGFSAGDVRDVIEGRAVARQLKLAGPEEVSIFGAVRIAVHPARSSISSATSRPSNAARRAASGKFHEPPRLEDLDELNTIATICWQSRAAGPRTARSGCRRP
jgi:hypothetical protein